MEKISKVKGYWACATNGIERMLRQPARIIVRILILPGHVPCCHAPALRWLSQYRERVWVSLIEFIPNYRALNDPQLNRRTSKAELAEIRELVKSYGLRDVEERSEEIWRVLRDESGRPAGLLADPPTPAPPTPLIERRLRRG